MLPSERQTIQNLRCGPWIYKIIDNTQVIHAQLSLELLRSLSKIRQAVPRGFFLLEDGINTSIKICCTKGVTGLENRFCDNRN